VVAPNSQSPSLVPHAQAQALFDEREFLKGCVRAEWEALRRGEGSIHIADGLSRRLCEVESRLFRLLAGEP
jgi:hypothetical protein